ncbi:hypothetical protein Q0M30_14060, partial [Staphylococcus aureus]|nr:hypothetical protein [Staphylococcus aureus]
MPPITGVTTFMIDLIISLAFIVNLLFFITNYTTNHYSSALDILFLLAKHFFNPYNFKTTTPT